MDNVKVLPCTCEHDFQDQVYGKQMRLHNVSQKGKNKGLALCSVCGPNRQRNKYDKNVPAKENKVFGMTYDIISLGVRNYK